MKTQKTLVYKLLSAAFVMIGIILMGSRNTYADEVYSGDNKLCLMSVTQTVSITEGVYPTYTISTTVSDTEVFRKWEYFNGEGGFDNAYNTTTTATLTSSTAGINPKFVSVYKPVFPSNAGSVSVYTNGGIGSTLTFTATPIPGKVFDHWTDSEGTTTISTNNPYSDTVPDEDSYFIKAVFVDAPTITFNPNGGSFAQTSDASATVGTDGKLTEFPEVQYDGHTLVGWFDDTADPNTAVELDKVYRGATTLTAHWTENPTTYNITVSKSGGGTASTASASATSAAAGANITLTATAAANYHFVNWTAEGVNISNATSPTGASFTMPSNAVTVTANFSQNSSTDHTITVTTDGHGTAQATPTSASNDAVITLSATPSTGYEFDRWTSTTNGIHFANYRSRNTTFDMVDENVTVKANFKAKSNPKKDDDDDDHHEESSSPEKPSWTPAKAAATIAAQKAQKQQAAATQLASIQTMLRTKTSDRAGTGRNVIDLDMTKVDILDPATVNLLLLNNRFAFNVKISVPGGLTTTIMIPANFNFRPFIKADGTMNIHEVLWWIISKRR